MGQAMMRVSLTVFFALSLGAQALAHSCDTLGGGVNCNAGRGKSNNSAQFDRKSPRVPERTIGPNEDDLKVIDTDTATDPTGRPKATFGGATFHSDGRQCTRIGLTVTCK